MRALVIANCTTQTYVEGLQKLFPDWEVRGVAEDRAQAWFADGSRPDFEAYLRACDLFIGEPADGRNYGPHINPAADKIFIPPLYFRGLHPDISLLPNFRGPLTVSAPSTQCSLVTLAARALDMNAADTEAMFCADIYREFGFLDLYKTQKKRLLGLFASHGIDLTAEFAGWEKIGAFFHVCHHPRPEVMTDILRRALVGRYLDAAAFEASAGLAQTQTDHLARAEVSPIYPEIAAPLGFQGSMTWIRPSRPERQRLSLSEFIEGTFSALDAMGQDWRKQSFVERAASVMKMYLDRPAGAAAAVPGHHDGPDPLAHLVGAERAAVDAAREAPYDTAILHGAMSLLRTSQKLAELDALYDAAPRATQCDSAVMSIWCSVPRMQRDGPEMLQRAEEMLRLHPGQAKARVHMIFALHATKGYEETMRQVEVWMAEFPDNPDIISTTAIIAHASHQWSVAEQYWRWMDKNFRGGLDAHMFRMLVMELRCQSKDAEAAQALDEARRKYPNSPALADM
jgi:Polysaccharide biosynthesis enzyme WcbI